MYNSVVLNRSQMRQLDQMSSGGNPEAGFDFMQKAGIGAAKTLESKWGAFDSDQIVLVIGKGNNGGDGLTMALHLNQLGAQVEVILLYHPENFRGEALLAWQSYEQSGLDWRLWDGGEIDWNFCDIIVDAILGLGARGEVHADLLPVIESIQESSDGGTYLFALDQPTGTLEADATALLGFTRWEAIDPVTADPYGEVGLVDLGYPEAIVREVIGIGECARLLDPQWYLPFLPLRDKFGDKRSHGTGLLYAGGEYMGGAAIMAGLGALRLGVGYLKIACAESERILVQSQLIEAPYVSIDKLLQELDWSQPNDLHEFDALALGPGLGLQPETQCHIKNLYQGYPKTAVLDADGLNAFKGSTEELKVHAGSRILTPHEAEFERLFGALPEALSARAKRVKEIAIEYDIEILLKGPVSILASSRGDISLYTQGSSALARAGSGDVLTGVLLALSTRWLAPELSYSVLCLGVWLHGMAAELAKDDHSEISMRSSEIPNYLGLAVDVLLNLMTQENPEYDDFESLGLDFDSEDSDHF